MKQRTTVKRASGVVTRSINNPKVLKPWSIAVFGVFFVLVAAFSITHTLAAATQLYMTPNTSSVNVGDTVTVSVRTEPSTAVDGVSTTVTYDPAVLEYVSVDSTGSGFPLQLMSRGGSGTVQIDRGIFPPDTVISDTLIGTITFKTLKASSGTNLVLTGNETFQGAYTNPTASGATVVVVAPPAPPAPGDTIAPSVTISSPLNGASSNKSFKINAAGSDNTAVTKMEVYVDNSIVQTTSGSSVSMNWNVKSKRIAKGAHTIKVKAYDAAGNVGESSVSVTKL